MHFGYDPAKSEANAEKHGIDFEEAQTLWDDPHLLTFSLQCKEESRWALLARYAGAVWFAVYTMRGEATRIIGVRRAIKGEVGLYDRQRNADS